MALDERVVIVGAGQAGGECVAALRMQGYQGAITLVGEEQHLPYGRPALSKAYLLGKCAAGELLLRPRSFYDEYDVGVITSRHVSKIDRVNKRIEVDGQTAMAYDRLIMATGGRPRRISNHALDTAANVVYLRAIADVDRLRSRFVPGSRLVVIGGGYVGLEVAAAARQLGLVVTVIEAAPRLLARVTSPEVSAFYERVHREEGVTVLVNSLISRFRFAEDGSVTMVIVGADNEISSDTVVIGVGMVPNVELAVEAGLVVDDGVVVDQFCRTSDPDILAIGDCSRHPCSEQGGSRRLESVPNAGEQARVAAAFVVGKPVPLDAVPWFWSDQYEVKLRVIGLSQPDDQVVIRGNAGQGRSFAAFYLRAGAVRSAQVVSDPRTFAAARKMVTARMEVDASLLADELVPMKNILATAVG